MSVCEMPSFGRARFTVLVRERVDVEAPRLFAVVRELGDRVDGRTVAWDLAFDDHAEVFCRAGGNWFGVRSGHSCVTRHDASSGCGDR